MKLLKELVPIASVERGQMNTIIQDQIGHRYEVFHKDMRPLDEIEAEMLKNNTLEDLNRKYITRNISAIKS